MADESELRDKIAKCLAEVREDPEAVEALRMFGFVTDDEIIQAYRYYGHFPELVTEEEILDALTRGGQTPLDHSFVIDEMIYYWNPALKGLWCRRIKDYSVFKACVTYLAARGQRFERWRDVLDWAEPHHWPGPEQLREALAKHIADEPR